MTIPDDLPEIQVFCDILGLTEEPIGMHYTPTEPAPGLSPQQAILPTAVMEAAGEVDWQATFANFSCVIGMIGAPEDRTVPQGLEGISGKKAKRRKSKGEKIKRENFF